MKVKGLVLYTAFIRTCRQGRAAAFTQFAARASADVNSRHHASKLLLMGALTERQMQFWGDVDDGLDVMERAWAKRGHDIDRIRTFAARAKGDIPPPAASVPGHEPSEEHIDGLTAKPFWDVVNDPELFPWARKLEERAHIIQKEYESKLQESVYATDSAWQNQVMGAGWSAVRLQRLGVWNLEQCDRFPETVQVIKSLRIPTCVRGVCLACQAPGTGVKPHSDGRNFILTSHLGLSIPEGCWIEVAGIRGGWQEGKLTTVDTSFVHSTDNPSERARHVLIIDFWHPDLTEAEKAGLEFIYDLRNQFESGKVPMRKPRHHRLEGGGIGSLWRTFSGGR